MFVGRMRELGRLEAMHDGDAFEMAVVYGRRRIGKTTLISRFCQGRRTIFFSAIESSASVNLRLLSEAIYACDSDDRPGSAPTFRSFDDAFSHLGSMAEAGRLILVIDEFPYLAAAEPAISSMLQHRIDHEWKSTKLFVILCGSSMSFMESQVLGYQSPLYGRRTAQFRIDPLDYLETARMFPKRPPEELAILYGIAGGVPLYAERLAGMEPLDSLLLNRFFDRGAFLFEEPTNLMKQELRSPQTYSAIILAISEGASRLSEIATKVGLESGLCTSYLQNLISLGIVRRETPVLEKPGRRSIYRIADNLFRFWHRFVPGSLAAISAGRMDLVLHRTVMPALSEYMGLVFEDMCMQYLMNHAGELPVLPGETGQWWGTDSVRRRQVQLDIVVVDPSGDKALVGECKFRNEPVDEAILKELRENAKALPGGMTLHWCLFSRSGFTDSLRRVAADEGVLLVDLAQMYGEQALLL